LCPSPHTSREPGPSGSIPVWVVRGDRSPRVNADILMLLERRARGVR
jgi:hypothetical protein